MFGFNFFKGDYNLYSPAKGKCLDITECSDVTFSKKILGDGFMVVPETGMIYSPCSGKIQNIFPTLHALGIEMKNGKEIMLHIGLETVKLTGRGFKAHVKEGDTVKPGDLLIEYDPAFMEKNKMDMSTMIVLLGTTEGQLKKMNLDKQVDIKDMIIKVD